MHQAPVVHTSKPVFIRNLQPSLSPSLIPPELIHLTPAWSEPSHSTSTFPTSATSTCTTDSTSTTMETRSKKARLVVRVQDYRVAQEVERRAQAEEKLEEKDAKLAEVAEKLEEKRRQYARLVGQLEERVRCPVCLEVPTAAPVYTCPQGHCICSSCFPSISSTCPLCRAALARSTSLLAATVLENILHECRFAGCRERVAMEEVEEHRRSCVHRRVPCPAARCTEEVTVVNLLNHALHYCQFNFARTLDVFEVLSPKMETTFYDTIGEETQTATYRWRGNYFFLNQRKLRSLRSFWMVLLGTAERCRGFRVTLHLTGGGASVTHTDHPLAVDTRDAGAAGLLVAEATMERMVVQVGGLASYRIMLKFAEV